MEASQPFCFVIMPFLPELNYFYLYVRDHVQRTHGIRCERADAAVLTIPILDKIVASISAADVVIADCTGRNPNVFYELGIAHTLEKPVILITSDEISSAPSDVRHFEFIKYGLSDERSFLARLDNALENVFATRYEAHYRAAREVLDEFARATGLRVEAAPIGLFARRLRALGGTLPPLAERQRLVRYLLPRIVLDGSDEVVMREVTHYVAERASEG